MDKDLYPFLVIYARNTLWETSTGIYPDSRDKYMYSMLSQPVNISYDHDDTDIT